MTEAINQHKALAMGKSIKQSSPPASNTSVKDSKSGGPKPASKNY